MLMQREELVIVTTGCTAVPAGVQHAAAQAGLMCDGRLVVDAAFRTNDPKIFAAGSIAKFSRR